MNYVDDTEMEEEGVAELLLDENATAAMPRPGTSLTRPMTVQYLLFTLNRFPPKLVYLRTSHYIYEGGARRREQGGPPCIVIWPTHDRVRPTGNQLTAGDGFGLG